jgi:CBS domain containing-hemolysin-like protein
LHPFFYFLILVIFLISTSLLTAVNGAFRRLHLQDPNFAPSEKHFFYRPFHLYFFPKYEYEGMLCATISAQSITRFVYAVASLAFLISLGLFHDTKPSPMSPPSHLYDFTNLWITLSFIGFVTTSFMIGDFIPRILGSRFPDSILRFCAPFASIFMFIAFPITYLCLKLSGSQFQSISFEEPLTQTKREIIDIIQRTKVGPELNTHEKKLIEYVLQFKDRIAREVMVPRVDVFSLSADTPIRRAAELVEKEGYSRIPIYRNTVDNIVGVLMYKDILNEYMEYVENGNDPAILDAPIERIQKNVLYTPETKKISNLLLEFRKKQVHLAIVVDEYGGTEGIVTIEDILEEIVGEIEDEYDEEEDMFFPQHDGSWVVDARMSILDVEEQLGINIPQEGEYDTIGGYIFHCAGSIPSKGYVIHQDDFEIEILRSDERKVERVRVKPLLPYKNIAENEKKEASDHPEKTGGAEEK